MKILMIHHSGMLGGGTLSCFDVINSLKEQGHNVILSLPIGDNKALKKAKEMNLDILNENIVPLTFGYYNGGSNIFKLIIKYFVLLKYKKKWIKTLEYEKPDLVLLNSIVQWPMIEILNNMKIRNICFVRETMKGSLSNIINRTIASKLEKSSGIAFLSEFDKKEWSLSSKVIQKVIPDTINIDEFKKGINKEIARKKLELKDDVKYILYVGGMSRLKGARTMIRAINQCKGNNIKLLFLGELDIDLNNSCLISRIKNRSRINFIKEINRYIEENDLRKHIELVGIQTNMNYWYAACDFVVFPAEKAHQARPIYEAGVFNKPAIVSDFSNYNEYLNDQISGLVFEPGNFIDLSKAINKLIEDSELCCELGKNNNLLTYRHHNSKITNNLIGELIKDVNL